MSTVPTIHEHQQATEHQLWKCFLRAGLEPSLRPAGGGNGTARRRWVATLHAADADIPIEQWLTPDGVFEGEGASRKVALRKLLNQVVRHTQIDLLAVWRGIDARAHGNPRAVEVDAKKSIDRKLPDRLLAVLNVICSAGDRGIIDRDVEDRLGWGHGDGAKRRYELYDAGLVDRNGRTDVSASTGHRGDCWVATPDGRKLADSLTGYRPSHHETAA